MRIWPGPVANVAEHAAVAVVTATEVGGGDGRDAPGRKQDARDQIGPSWTCSLSLRGLDAIQCAMRASAAFPIGLRPQVPSAGFRRSAPRTAPQLRPPWRPDPPRRCLKSGASPARASRAFRPSGAFVGSKGPSRHSRSTWVRLLNRRAAGSSASAAAGGSTPAGARVSRGVHRVLAQDVADAPAACTSCRYWAMNSRSTRPPRTCLSSQGSLGALLLLDARAHIAHVGGGLCAVARAARAHRGSPARRQRAAPAARRRRGRG